MQNVSPHTNSITQQFVAHEPDTLVIKGKFKLATTSTYGVFVILLDKEIRKEKNYQNFLELHVIVSYFSDLFNMDLSEPWFSLEKKFNQIRISGDFATSLTNIFYQELRSRFAESTGFTHTLIDDCRAKNFEKIERWVADICNQIHKDRQIEVRIFTELIYSHELASVRDLRTKKEITPSTKDINFDKIHPPENSAPVPTIPILAPTGRGILVKHIKLNTKILVQLDPKSTKFSYWKQYFGIANLKKETLIPLVATVNQISDSIKNRRDILVSLSENLYSRFDLEAGIKIKPFDIHSSQKVLDLSANKKNSNTNSSVILSMFHDKAFVMLLAAAVITIITSVVVSYLYMS